jgi:hypothetical protein
MLGNIFHFSLIEFRMPLPDIFLLLGIWLLGPILFFYFWLSWGANDFNLPRIGLGVGLMGLIIFIISIVANHLREQRRILNILNRIMRDYRPDEWDLSIF